MVKVDITKKEIEALDIILKKTKAPIIVGFLVGGLRAKRQQAVQKEEETKLREQYGKKDGNRKA